MLSAIEFGITSKTDIPFSSLTKIGVSLSSLRISA